VSVVHALVVHDDDGVRLVCTVTVCTWRARRSVTCHTPDCRAATDTLTVRIVVPAVHQRATPRRREMDVTDDKYPTSQPRAEQFDALVRELYPTIRRFSPHLSPVEALRAATRMAEYRMDDEATLMWGIERPRRA